MSAVAHQRILIDDYFDLVVQQNASDLHLQEGQPPKMRLHGDILPIRETALTHAEMEQMLSEVAGPDPVDEFRPDGRRRSAYELNADARFRCNLHRQLHGLGASSAHPEQDRHAGAARRASGDQAVRQSQGRPRPRHRPDRLR